MKKLDKTEKIQIGLNWTFERNRQIDKKDKIKKIGKFGKKNGKMNKWRFGKS